MTPTIAAWDLVSAIGVLVGLVIVGIYFGDRAAWKRTGRGIPARLMIQANIRNACFVVVISGLFLVTGIMAGFPSIDAIWPTVALFIANSLLTVNLGFTYVQRRQVARMLNRERS